MSDPAVDAAKQASEKWNVQMVNYDNVITSAAFQALAPVRGWYERWEGADPDEHDILDLMAELRPLIYSSEEL